MYICRRFLLNMKKKLFLLTAFLGLFLSLSAQKVDLKKGYVYFDKVEMYSFEKEQMGNFTLVYKKDTKDLLFSILFHTNGTVGYSNDDYLKLYFTEGSTIIETTQLAGIWPAGLIERFIKRGVINPADGSINPESLKAFAAQYDEKISSRLIIR